MEEPGFFTGGSADGREADAVGGALDRVQVADAQPKMNGFFADAADVSRIAARSWVYPPPAVKVRVRPLRTCSAKLRHGAGSSGDTLRLL